MKKTVFLFAMLVLSSLGIAQNNEAESNLTLIPSGDMEMKTDSTSQGGKITLRSFWVSNEITNKEFRECLNYAKQHPEEKLEWVDLKLISGNYNIETKKFEGSTLNDKKVSMQYCLYKEIIENEIDTLALAKEYPLNSENYKKFQNYISAKIFDDYPVVGVSYKGAQYYCVWRTKMENEKLESEGKKINMSYRLPTKAEWLYAHKCSSEKLNQAELNNSSIISNIGSNEVLYFNGNVSEWVSSNSSKSEIHFTLGSSWKNQEIKNEKKVVEKNIKTGDIGFRVVRDTNL